jgi:KaiC/GvpD/RAD55 family RecA-like ATPase
VQLFLGEHVRTLYRALNHGELFSECRTLKVGGDKRECRVQAFPKGEEAFVRWAYENNRRFEDCNIYVGRNPRNADNKVARITSVSFDLDPIYDHKVGSSEPQIRACLRAAKDLISVYPGGYVAFTGNGVLVLYSAVAPVETDLALFRLRYRAFEERIRSTVLKPYAKEVVCDKTFDGARLVKLVGCLSVKSAKPRITRFLDLPSRPVRRDGIFRAILATAPAQSVSDREFTAGAAGGPGGAGSLVGPDGRPLGAGSAGLIGHPHRHKFLLSIAGSLRRRGLTTEAIFQALKAAYEERCDKNPPKTDEDLRNLAADITGRYEPEPTGGLYGGEAISVSNANRYRSRLSGDARDPVAHDSTTSMGLYEKRLFSPSNAAGPELPTGFPTIDEMTDGLQRAELLTVGAFTAFGKTTFCINIAKHLAERGKSVLYLSTELTFNKIWDKFMSLGTGIPGKAFEKRRLTPEQRAIYDQYKTAFAKYRLWIFDELTPAIDKVERLVKRHNPDVVFFDHLHQLGDGEEKKAHIIAAFLEDFRQLARDYNFAPVAISQFHRPKSYIDYKDNYQQKTVLDPTVFDFKESGEIENKSRYAILISTTDDMTLTKTPTMIVKLAKNSFGETGVIPMLFDKAYCKFTELRKEN